MALVVPRSRKRKSRPYFSFGVRSTNTVLPRVKLTHSGVELIFLSNILSQRNLGQAKTFISPNNVLEIISVRINPNRPLN